MRATDRSALESPSSASDQVTRSMVRFALAAAAISGLSCTLSEEHSGNMGIPVARVVAQAQYEPDNLLVVGDELLWIANDALRMVAKGGGAVRTLAVSSIPITSAAVAGGWVYWTRSEMYASPTPIPVVLRARLDGSAAEELYTGTGSTALIAVDEAGVYFAYDLDMMTVGVLGLPFASAPLSFGSYRHVLGLTTHQGRLYWINGGETDGIIPGHAILSCPVSGCSSAPEALASVSPYATALAAHRGYLYWLDGALYRVPVTGGSREPVTVSTGDRFAIDDQAAYCSYTRMMGNRANSQGGIWQRAWSDGALTHLMLETELIPRSVAVDDTSIYWTSPADGTVMAMERWPGGVADSVSYP
jgi:hypothetical protein